MSFGFGVGDIIKAIEICTKLRHDFSDAPRQVQELGDEIRSLSIALQDVDVYASSNDLEEGQRLELENTGQVCQTVLHDMRDLVDKNRILDKAGGGSNKAKRVWKRLTWNPDDIRDLRSRVNSSAALLNAFHSRVARVNTTKLVQHVEDRKLRAALNWLSPIDYGPQQSDFIARRQPNTGQWLLESDEFQHWIQTPGTTMFCPGIPGAGKTILTSVVVHHLLLCAERLETIGVAYTYFNFRRAGDQTFVSSISNLLKQLAQQHPSTASEVKELYDAHQKTRTRPSIDELLIMLRSNLVLSPFKRIFIVVDALDECKSTDNCRNKFISELLNLQRDRHINFFATSRFIPEIRAAFPKQSTIVREIRASKEDIQIYLANHLDTLPSCVRRSLALQEEIKAVIATAVGGMFLLAQIYISSLDDKLTAKAIRRQLGYFQDRHSKTDTSEDAKLETLSQAYGDAMDRIQQQKLGFRELAIKTLSWIVSARRPLEIEELQYALAIEEDETELDEDNVPEIEDILSVCAGLVTVDEESDIVRLVHYTTQQYFEQTRINWFPEAEWNITRACLTYMMIPRWAPGVMVPENYRDVRMQHKSSPVHGYICRNWGHHLARAGASAQKDPRVTAFFRSQELMSFWGSVERLRWDRMKIWIPVPDDKSTVHRNLHVAAHFNLAGVIDALLAEQHPQAVALSDMEDSEGLTPLVYAASAGSLETLKSLLHWGASIAGLNMEKALHVAAEYGHAEIVTVLLEHGAKVNQQSNKACWSVSYLAGAPCSPLHMAASGGHAKTVEALLANGADVEAEALHGRMPIHCAAESGSVLTVQSLINHGADIESWNRELVTPLMLACSRGHVEVVELLLRLGASTERIDGEGRTALSRAACWSREPVIHALVNAGAVIDHQDIFGVTPMFEASANDDAAIVKFFLSQGAHVEAYRKFIHRYAFYRGPQDSDLTPLLYTAKRDCLESAAILLQHGADLEARNAYGQTPLILAVSEGSWEVAKFLILQGADVHATDRGGRSALWEILFSDRHDGRIELGPLLVERGARLKTRRERAVLQQWMRSVDLAPPLEENHVDAVDSWAREVSLPSRHRCSLQIVMDEEFSEEEGEEEEDGDEA